MNRIFVCLTRNTISWGSVKREIYIVIQCSSQIFFNIYPSIVLSFSLSLKKKKKKNRNHHTEEKIKSR